MERRGRSGIRTFCKLFSIQDLTSQSYREKNRDVTGTEKIGSRRQIKPLNREWIIGVDPGQLGREARGQLQCILRVTNNGKDPKVKTPDLGRKAVSLTISFRKITEFQHMGIAIFYPRAEVFLFIKMWWLYSC